jgi:polysaccharide deacetylase family protein (PEP-CTERM system associated)
MNRKMVNAPTSSGNYLLSFDMEDWYHLSGTQICGTGTLRPDIVERQLDRILDLLDRRQCKATFFCLGSSFVDSPHLIRRIVESNHEIASHGWGHEPIYRIGLDAFRQDLHRSLTWLRDLTGAPIYGYRAPAFSVASHQLEGFYDICFEEGLSYDTSVFPIEGRRYGIPDAPTEPTCVRNAGARKLIELPLTTVPWKGRRWPIAGGGYWRLLPSWVLYSALDRVTRQGLPVTTYFHPYEFDPFRLNAQKAAGWSFRSLMHGLKQNLGRRSLYGKLDNLLQRRQFGPIKDYLDAAGLL